MTVLTGKLGRLVIALALCMATGGHWALLQTVAWSGMLIRFSQEGDFARAIVRTFDGSSPCGLCKTVQEGQKEERKKSPSHATAKVELKYLKPEATPLAAPAAQRHDWPEIDSDAGVLTYRPAVPVPRARV